MTDYHSGNLTLDVPEGYSECEARYEIEASWSHRNGRGYRQVLHISGVSLDEWTFNGRRQTRDTAVELLGEAEVERQEDLALIEWRETAEQDDADSYGDYARDRREEMRWAAE